MDNLSHSLVGLAAGELVQRSLPAEATPEHQRLRRRLLLLAGWAASNFPDLDLFLTKLLPAPLGYLLHHRGHTHTLLYALPQALLLVALIWLFWPAARALLRSSRSARIGLLAAVTLGFVLHLSMDGLNVYGVHPFHPFDSRWLYGDTVFILEPVFWIAFGVPLALMVPRPAARWLFLALLAAVPVYFTFKAFLAWGSLAMLAAIALGLALLRGRAALLGALAVCVAFVGIEAAASAHGKRMVAAELKRIDPASRTIDAALSAFPSNPLCWTFASVERNDAAGTFRVRRGVLSVADDIMPAAACPASMRAPGAHPALTAAMTLTWEREGSIAHLQQLKESNCHFAAWLRFARIPVLADDIASDARFGADPSDNFTAMPYTKFDGQPCPRLLPRWDFPRADLVNRR